MGFAILTVRFACELAALAILAWWGARTAGAPLAIAAPLAAALLWGAWVAPKASRRLRDPLRFAAESVVWAGSTAALVALGHAVLAAGFAAISLVTAVLARRHEPAATGGEVRNSDGSSAFRA